jgi:hypothetical protein
VQALKRGDPVVMFLHGINPAGTVMTDATVVLGRSVMASMRLP